MKIKAAALLLGCLLAVPAWAADFRLTSPDIAEGKTMAGRHVFKGFGCAGDNVSPALTWSSAPAGAKSFALMVYDPDAPTGSGWWHWVVYNLPAAATSLPSGASLAGLPPGAVQGRTDYGTPGYGGPCPPPGTPHRYVFTLHALDVEALSLPADASAAMVGFMVNSHSLGKASLTALYGR